MRCSGLGVAASAAACCLAAAASYATPLHEESGRASEQKLVLAWETPVVPRAGVLGGEVERESLFPTVAPEPATLVLLTAGLAGLTFVGRPRT